jgi:hypothetical protein
LPLPIRKILADSQVGAIAAATLIIWSIYWACVAIPWAVGISVDPIVSAATYIATAIAIRGLPASSSGSTLGENFELVIAAGFIFNALSSLLAAWLLTRWIYRADPFHALKTHLVIFRRHHV